MTCGLYRGVRGGGHPPGSIRVLHVRSIRRKVQQEAVSRDHTQLPVSTHIAVISLPPQRCVPVVFRCVTVVFRCVPVVFRCVPVVFRCVTVVFRCVPVVSRGLFQKRGSTNSEPNPEL